MFDFFVQEPQALDRARGGFGLGLEVVKHLVELHGGSVSAQSAGVDQGSEFVIRLQAIAPPPAVVATAAAAGAAAPGPAGVCPLSRTTATRGTCSRRCSS